MFGAPLPDPDAHPEMMTKAQGAFTLLREAVARMQLGADDDLTALYVWSTMHGLASIMQLQMFDSLSVARHDLAEMVGHVLGRIGTGLSGD